MIVLHVLGVVGFLGMLAVPTVIMWVIADKVCPSDPPELPKMLLREGRRDQG